jgi:hypothetical protein
MKSLQALSLVTTMGQQLQLGESCPSRALKYYQQFIEAPSKSDNPKAGYGAEVHYIPVKLHYG